MDLWQTVVSGLAGAFVALLVLLRIRAARRGRWGRGVPSAGRRRRHGVLKLFVFALVLLVMTGQFFWSNGLVRLILLVALGLMAVMALAYRRVRRR